MSLSPSVRKGPLQDLVVVDLTRYLAGPYCSLLLADLGARVIKIETPQRGDDSRHVPPLQGGQSTYFMSINRGKESLALNLKDEPDRELLHKLLSEADILVENFRPGVMDKLGLTEEHIRSTYPELIYASISGFGQTGPWRDLPAYDLVVQALSGMMSINGQADGPPTRVGTSIGDLGAGLYAALAIVSAVHERARTGEGSRVDISMLDCQVALLESHYMRYSVTGEIPDRVGSRHPLITPFDTFEAADGHFVICTVGDAMFQQLMRAIEREDLLQDPRFQSPQLRLQHEPELKSELEKQFRGRARAHWLELIGEAGIPCSPINTVADMIDNPQLEQRNIFVDLSSGAEVEYKAVRTPFAAMGYGSGSPQDWAPMLDEHGPKIRSEFE